jgi:hypothetical protein
MICNNIKECQYLNLDNIGIIYDKFTNEQLQPIRDEIEEIKVDFKNSLSHNMLLCGHMQNQFTLRKTEKYVEDLMLPYAEIYNDVYPAYLRRNENTSKTVPYLIKKPWVNFQLKHEFNPLHQHTGVFSFVIYLEIPYLIEEEKKVFPENKVSINGQFCFGYSNILGELVTTNIPIDKKSENIMLFFPSKLGHYVNPFYTSDKYRISVSGNILLNTG